MMSHIRAPHQPLHIAPDENNGFFVKEGSNRQVCDRDWKMAVLWSGRVIGPLTGPLSSWGPDSNSAGEEIFFFMESIVSMAVIGCHTGSSDISVGVVTRLQDGRRKNRGSIAGRGRRFMFCPRRPHWLMGLVTLGSCPGSRYWPLIPPLVPTLRISGVMP